MINEKLNKCIHDCAEEIFDLLDQCNVKKSDIDAGRKSFKEGIAKVSLEKIDYCIKKFIVAELDYSAPGYRGLGRYTDYYPRLAACYRGSFSNINPDQFNEIKEIITKIIIKTFIYPFTVRVGTTMNSSVTSSSEELYEKWIPIIYSENSKYLDDSTLDSLVGATAKDCQKMDEFFLKNNFKSDMAGDDKMMLITLGYMLAGFTLFVADHY